MTSLDRTGYTLDFEDRFATLDESRWLPFYLPQWASRAGTRARYEVGDGLCLLIEEDQPPWAPQYDGPLRVSNLQTGVRSGPLGSHDGQLRFKPDVTVSEEQTTQQLYTPTYGLVEVRSRAIPEPHCMVALWLIGFEQQPHESGELCVMEIFGSEIEGDRAKVGMGIHPWFDPALTEEFEKVELVGDATAAHTYSVEWMPGRTNFYLDELLVKTCAQAPDYPLQLMLDVYEFEPGGEYPKRFHVEFVRGWSRA